jgi:hypothetical protein
MELLARPLKEIAQFESAYKSEYGNMSDSGRIRKKRRGACISAVSNGRFDVGA